MKREVRLLFILAGIFAAACFLAASLVHAGGQLGRNKPGLMGLWHLNEGAGTITYDASGNGNNGTLQNSPAWITGKFGTGLNFGPGNTNPTKRVDIANESFFDFEKTDPFYLVCFVTFIDEDPNNGTLFAKNAGLAPTAGWSVDYQGFTLRRLSFKVSDGTNKCIMSTSILGSTNPVTGTPLFDGRYHSLIAWWGGDNNCSNLGLYLDGSSVTWVGSSDVGKLNGSILNNTAVSLGAINLASDNWHGAGDEFAIYRGTVTPTQAMQIHRSFFEDMSQGE